jgi:hypothetical protein|tara:strand:+ start:417 stop:593 length:177 start_codon:yes stop_codon:yes gene_type:complete
MKNSNLSDKCAWEILWDFYITTADDYEGLTSDLKITFERGETLQQFAEQCLKSAVECV